MAGSLGFTGAALLREGSGLAWRLAASVAFCIVAPPAWSQQAPDPPAQTPATTAESETNVVAYPPSFFAEFRPNTAFDMITRLPGFSFDGGSSARGFSGTAGNVLIDGERPPSRSDSLSSVLSRIPASAVVRIDVIRGGAGGIDMQGKAIIANVIRKKDAGLTGAISGGANSNDRGDVGANGTIQVQNQSGGRLLEGAISANTNTGSGDQFRSRVDPTGATILQGSSQSENQFDFAQATGAYETPLFGGKFRANGQVSRQNSEFNEEETLTIPVGEFESSDGLNERTAGEVGLRYTRNFGGYGLEVVGFQSLSHNVSTSGFDTSNFTSGGQSTSDGGESIGRATLRFPALGKLTFEGGGEIVYNFTETESARLLNGQLFPLPGDAFEANERRSEAFGTATWAPSRKLSAELGARYEWSTIEAGGSAGASEKSVSYFKPRLNISWSPEEGHQYGLRIERVVDQLSFSGFASSASFTTNVFGIGNPEIEPEKSWIVDARYERQFGGQNSFVAQYIHRQVEDVLGRTVVAVQTSPTAPVELFEITRNVGEATRDSLDLHGTFTLDDFGMKGGLINLGVELRDSETIDPVTLETRKMSGDTAWEWNFSLQQTLDNGNFRWALFIEDNDDSHSWSPRSVSKNSNGMFIGANFTWKPAPGWTFGGGLNNIGAWDSRSGSLFFNAPRSFGTPLYFEKYIYPATRTFFVNLRKNF